ERVLFCRGSGREGREVTGSNRYAGDRADAGAVSGGNVAGGGAGGTGAELSETPPSWSGMFDSRAKVPRSGSSDCRDLARECRARPEKTGQVRISWGLVRNTGNHSLYPQGGRARAWPWVRLPTAGRPATVIPFRSNAIALRRVCQ